MDEKTWAELQELRLCGTEYRIPLFSEVLDTVRGRGPLIVELKSGRRNRELCEKTYAMLQNYRGEACIESFNPFIVSWFRFHAPELLRGQLATDSYEGRGALQSFLLRNCLFNWAARPQFIAYKLVKRPLAVRFSELLGAMRVAWTSHEPRNEKGQDAVIFEFYKPRETFK